MTIPEDNRNEPIPRRPSFPREVAAHIGRCIYCGTDGTDLSDEHIIPFSLGGNRVLEAASCASCSKITGAFEQEIARKMLPYTRARFGMPTRRGRDRPATFPMQVIVDGIEETVLLPMRQYIPMIILPLYDPPVIFDLRAYKGGIRLRGLGRTIFEDGSEQELDHLFGKGNWRVILTITHEAWARMLAKIAYCFSVADLGLGSLEHTFVLPSILGIGNDVGRWVGSMNEPPRIGNSGLHGVQFGFHRNIYVVHVRLFAQLEGPEYVVAVGDVSTATRQRALAPQHD